MGLDEDDQPKGALIGMTLITCIIIFIVLSTFDSCTNMELDAERKYCNDVRMTLEGPIGEKRACINEEGKLLLTIVNVGDVDIEGMAFKFRGKSENITKECYTLSSQTYQPNVGEETYHMMAPIEVLPIVYFEKENKTIICSEMKTIIKDPDLCTSY